MSAHATSPSYPESYLERQEILAALPNRAMFADLMEAALERAGGEAMCMVLVLDVTRFRQVNERYARVTGDEVLTAIAGLLKRLAGSDAVVGSLGADEFALLVPGPHTHKYAVSLAKSIATVLDPPASVGIAFAQPGSDAAAVLGAADRARTGAQERGDPNGIFAATREAQVARSLQLEQELRGAIDGGQLCLYYQPIIDVKSGRSTGLTARVRWEHPVYGLLAPGHFLPTAEAGSLASDLGAEIIALACRDLAHWSDSVPLPGPPPVHVKVSARQLCEPGFVEIILGELQRGGVDPSLLAVELAGSVVVDEGDVVPRALQRLAEAGITAVLDDFGTGSAPPSSLKDIPVRGLKIGSVFVNGLPDSEADVRMTEAMISMGRSLKLPVVAKCVETHAQLATVRGLGCERAQGFLFGRPAAADVTLALLRQAVDWGQIVHAAGLRTRPWGRAGSGARGDGSPGDQTLLSLGQAARALGVSQATLRRWTDSGKLRSTRTAGGHRRFAPADLRGMATSSRPAEIQVGPMPTEPLPALSRLVHEHGDRLAAASWAKLYVHVPGFFSDPSWDASRSTWLRALASTAASGHYEELAEATATLMLQAETQGTSLLERQSALERFTEAAVHLLAREGAPGSTIMQTRRLFAFLRHHQLSLAG